MSYIGQTLPADTFQGFTTDSFAGDGSATTFTLSKTPFNESALLVVINNVVQKPTTNFTVSGTTLTIVGTAVASGDVIYATHIGGALPIGQAASLDLNGASDQLILDADADTTISADTDDQIDIKIAGADDFQFTANTFTAQSGSTITTPTLGVGNTKDLGSGIHIKTADSGASVSSTSDELVIEGSSVGMSFLDATDGATRIAFGDSGDNDIGKIVYGHSSNQMEFVTNAAAGLVISSDGEVTKPLQPMASARPTSAVTNITGDGTLAYLGNSIGATERFDVGGCFSNDGMLFVAPITGKYLLCGQLIFSGLASNHTLSYFMLVTSNQTYYPLYGAELDTVGYLGSHGSSFAIIADMDANDSAQLAMQVYGGSKVVDASTSTFLTGMLLA